MINFSFLLDRPKINQPNCIKKKREFRLQNDIKLLKRANSQPRKQQTDVPKRKKAWAQLMFQC